MPKIQHRAWRFFARENIQYSIDESVLKTILSEKNYKLYCVCVCTTLEAQNRESILFTCGRSFRNSYIAQQNLQYYLWIAYAPLRNHMFTLENFTRLRYKIFVVYLMVCFFLIELNRSLFPLLTCKQTIFFQSRDGILKINF